LFSYPLILRDIHQIFFIRRQLLPVGYQYAFVRDDPFEIAVLADYAVLHDDAVLQNGVPADFHPSENNAVLDGSVYHAPVRHKRISNVRVFAVFRGFRIPDFRVEVSPGIIKQLGSFVVVEPFHVVPEIIVN